MLEAMGAELDSDAGWRRRCEATLVEMLAEPSFATFVVDAAPGHLAGCVSGWIDRRLPGPHRDGRVGYVANLSTDLAWRRKGVGTALLDAALNWFTQQGVDRVDLRATAEGRRIYEKAGFREAHGMRWQRPALDPTS